jgi:hypothetical protein
MSRGSKSQLEKFAEGLALGHRPAEAARYAGYPEGTSFAGNARKRAQRADVKIMVEALRKPAQAKMAQRIDITLQTLLEKAMRIYDAAMAAEQFGAAVAALKEIGVLSGKRVERSEQGSPGEFDHMTDEELRQAVEERAEAIGFVRKTETQH